MRHGLEQTKNDKRSRLLAALFSQAKKKGIAGDDLREVIAPNVIRKRLSKASMQEIVRVIEHLSGKKRNEQRAMSNERKYESSKKGLIEELEDVARQRWGTEFEKPLNAFINSHRKTPTHYRFLDVAGMKTIKKRLIELQKGGKYEKRNN